MQKAETHYLEIERERNRSNLVTLINFLMFININILCHTRVY